MLLSALLRRTDKTLFNYADIGITLQSGHQIQLSTEFQYSRLRRRVASTTLSKPPLVRASIFQKSNAHANDFDHPHRPSRVLPETSSQRRTLSEHKTRSTGLLGEAGRCVHICDREGDIWELFCLARELDTHFLVFDDAFALPALSFDLGQPLRLVRRRP